MIRDFDTTIPCPGCSVYVKHRYNCTCQGVCTKRDDHTMFHCRSCGEQKVDWNDEVGDSRGEVQPCTPTSTPSEQAALQKLLDKLVHGDPDSPYAKSGE